MLTINRLQVVETAGIEAGRVCIQSAQSVPHWSSGADNVQPAQPVAKDGRAHVPDVARPACLLRPLPRGVGRASQRRLPVPEGPTCARQRRGHHEVRVHAQHAALSPEAARRVPSSHVTQPCA